MGKLEVEALRDIRLEGVTFQAAIKKVAPSSARFLFDWPDRFYGEVTDAKVSEGHAIGLGWDKKRWFLIRDGKEITQGEQPACIIAAITEDFSRVLVVEKGRKSYGNVYLVKEDDEVCNIIRDEEGSPYRQRLLGWNHDLSNFLAAGRIAKESEIHFYQLNDKDKSAVHLFDATKIRFGSIEALGFSNDFRKVVWRGFISGFLPQYRRALFINDELLTKGLDIKVRMGIDCQNVLALVDKLRDHEIVFNGEAVYKGTYHFEDVGVTPNLAAFVVTMERMPYLSGQRKLQLFYSEPEGYELEAVDSIDNLIHTGKNVISVDYKQDGVRRRLILAEPITPTSEVETH